jgi:TetR/AcrR family transcriptional regulator, transcriptional repressor for nem operon
MRYDADHKDRTRKRLLDEAARALRSEGPERVGVAALMARLGLTHGGFYAHFKSKDDLVAQAIEETFAQTAAGAERMIVGRTPAEALTRYVDFSLSDRHCAAPGQGCALPALSTDVSRLGRSARQKFQAGTQRLTEFIAGLLRGMGYDEKPAHELAISALAEMAGAIAIARAMETPQQAQEIRASCRASVKQRLGLPVQR